MVIKDVERLISDFWAIRDEIECRVNKGTSYTVDLKTPNGIKSIERVPTEIRSWNVCRTFAVELDDGDLLISFSLLPEVCSLRVTAWCFAEVSAWRGLGNDMLRNKESRKVLEVTYKAPYHWGNHRCEKEERSILLWPRELDDPWVDEIDIELLKALFHDAVEKLSLCPEKAFNFDPVVAYVAKQKEIHQKSLELWQELSPCWYEIEKEWDNHLTDYDPDSI